MSDKFQEKLVLAEKEIYRAKFAKAEEILEDILDNKKLTEEQRLTTLVLKAEYLNHLGEYKKAVTIVDEVLKVTENEKSLLRVKALSNKGYAHCLLGDLAESMRLIQEIEKSMEELENISKVEFDKSKMFLLSFKTGFYYFTADIPNLKTVSEESIALAKKCKNDFFLFTGWLNNASYYALIGNFAKVNEIFTKKMAVIVERSDNEMLSILLKFYTITFYQPKSLEDMMKKIKTMEEYIIEMEAIGTKSSLGIFYNNTAVSYSAILDTDKALEYYHKSYNLYKLSFSKTMYLNNVADQYIIKRDFETARDYYQQSLDYSQEIKSPFLQTVAIRGLITVNIELGNIEPVNSYLEEFKQLAEALNQEVVTNNYMIAVANVLTVSSKMKDWVKAQEIYEELLTKDLSDLQKISVYFNNSELLIKELHMTGDDDTLAKLKENISKMIDIANKKVYHQVSINLLRLQSKLALIEYQEEKAKKLLLEAKTIAENAGLSKFAAEIEEERIALDKQKEFWQASKKRDEPLKTRLEHVAITKSMKEMKEKTVIDERNEETGQFIGQQKLFAIKF